MKPLLSALALLLFLCSSPQVFATVSYDSVTEITVEDEKSYLDKALKAVFGGADYVFDDFESSDNDDGGKTLNASVALFGESNVDVTANYQSERISNFEIEFPEEAKFDIQKINEIVDGKLTNYLPSGLPLSAGVFIEGFSVDFGESGALPKEIQTTLGLAADWDLLDNGGITANGVDIELSITNPKEPSREISGTVSGGASVGEIDLTLSSLLSTNTEDTEITASIEQINLSSVVDTFLPKKEGADLLSLTPELFKSLNLSMLELGIKPVSKELNITANSTLGNVIVGLEKNGAASDILFAIRPADSLKFSQLSEVLSPLDGLDFSNSYFILSDKQTQIPAKFLNDKESDSKTFPVKKGLNMVSSIALPENISEILKVNDVTLSGTLPSDLAGISLAADLNFGMEFGDGAFSFDRLTAGLIVGKGDLEMSFTGAGSFQAGDDRVEIFGGLFMDVISMQVGFEAGLAAGGARLEAPVNCLAPQPEWSEPFGIPGVGVRRLGIGAAVGTTFPWINQIQFEGNLRVGTVKDQSQHVCGAVTAVANIADFSESMLVAEVQNLTIIKMVEAFVEDSGIEGSLRDAMDTGIESAKLKIVPKEMEVFGRSYTKGVALDSAQLKLLGMDAMLGFSISESGIKAYGSMDPLIVEEGGFTFFAIQGVKPDQNGNPTGPSISLGLDAEDPHFKLDGSITVLEIESETFVKIDKSGFEFTTSGNVLDGALSVTATISASDFTEDSGLYAKVAFENKLQSMVADELIKFIEEETKKNQEAYKNAKRVLEETKGNNDFEQFWIDASKETVNAFQEMDKAAAIAGTYVVEGLLEEALNIRKISFEGEVTSMKATVSLDIDMTIAGQDIVEQVSLSLNLSEDAFVDAIVDLIGDDVIEAFGSLDNEISSAFEDLGDELETAFEDLGNEIVNAAEVVGEGVITGAEFIGDAFSDAAREVETFFEGSSDTHPVNSGRAPNRIPVNTSHFRVRVDKIVVTGDEGGLGPALELFGGVLVLPYGSLSANEGATPYVYSRAERNAVETSKGGSISIGKIRDFYVDNNYISNSGVNIISAMGEFNTFGGAAGDSEKITGGVSLRFSPNMNTQSSFSASDGEGESIDVYYSVWFVEKRGPIPSKEQMIAAVRSAQESEINRLVNDGGSLRHSGMIEAAIESKNPYMVQRLLQAGNYAKSSQVELALVPQYYQENVAQMLINSGASATSEALLSVTKQNKFNMVKYLAERGAVPQLDHLQAAIQLDNLEMVNYLNSIANIPITSNELNYAINKKDVALAKNFIKKGAPVESQMIIHAVNMNSEDLVKELLTRGTPNHEALQAAANQNNTAIFKRLSLRTPLTNNQPIYTAIDKNNMDIVLQGLKHGGTKADVLNYAVQRKNQAAIQLCLDRGANATPVIDYAVSRNDLNFFTQIITQYGANTSTALESSFDSDRFEMAEVALKNGANPNVRMKQAALDGKQNWVTLFLNYKADPNLGMKSAVDAQQTKIVEQLLTAGAKGEDRNLIVSAASNKNLDIVKLLVEKGNASAEYARPTSIQKNDMPTLAYLLDHGAKATGVKTPAQNGWMPMVKLLVEKGADPNEGMAASIEYDRDDIAIYLLDNGADVGNYISTSVQRGDYNVVAKLLEKGADADAGAFNAVRYKHTNIMKLLIENGADASRESLMDGAVINMQLDMVKLLLANGGDIKFVTKKGETYLHRVAGKAKQDQLVLAFIEAGIDLEAKNKNQETALHLAVRKGNKNLQSVKNLVENGANVNAVDKKNRTVLKRAKGKKVKDYLSSQGARKSMDN